VAKPVDLLVRGRPVVYLAAGVALPDELAARTANLDRYAGLDSQLALMPNARRVLLTSARPAPLFHYVLLWPSDTALDLLDERVARAAATDDDFAGAILAEARHVTCLGCEVVHRVLAFEAGMPPFGVGSWMRDAPIAFVDACPSCGASWRTLGALAVL